MSAFGAHSKVGDAAKLAHGEGAEARHHDAIAQPVHIALAKQDARSSAETDAVGGGSKRLFDIIAAFAGLLVLGPPLLMIAAAIALDGCGSPLFVQERTGLKGRIFLILKFRTMTVAQGQGQIEQVQRNDARVTMLGQILRRLSIDELPQLWNVLMGEMSLVGPRPHPVSLDHEFEAKHPQYWRRFEARPGLTGLAQVSGSRGPVRSSEALEKRTEFDLRYVDQWSLLLDIKIICKTAMTVWSDPDAY